MHHRRALARAGVLAGVAACALTGASPASAQLSDVNTQRLRNAVTVNGILSHERVFQRIANRNDGTRASGTSGYDESAEYVARRLDNAGYDVTTQEFTFPFFRNLADPTVTVGSTSYETTTFEYSGSGNVTGVIVPANNNQIPSPGGSTAGCEPSNYQPAPAEPAIALVQRGTCTIEIKAANAQAAGYEAVIVFNEGNTPEREGVITNVTLGRPFTIPVVSVSYADGVTLVNETPTATVTTSTEIDLEATTTNVIADSPGGNPEQTVVVGAHLDSVVEGPGINDNGSGSSTILEIAEAMDEIGVNPRRAVRFAFWGAEENGLLGSEYYVENLDDDAFGEIYANLNFDMVGSPNYVRFVYDGDGSEGTAGPPGSGQIESLFNGYFDSQGLPTEPTDFDGRSDYGPFIAAGIPAGGLFTGAEGIKTAAEAAIYGGTAGIAYDPCYHQACDTINNLSTKALNEMSDAAAHATLTLARSRTGFFEDGSRRGAQRTRALAYDGHEAKR